MVTSMTEEKDPNALSNAPFLGLLSTRSNRNDGTNGFVRWNQWSRGLIDALPDLIADDSESVTGSRGSIIVLYSV